MRKIFLIIVGLLFISGEIEAQGTFAPKKSQLIGFQFNPYVDRFLFEEGYAENVFAVRYGYTFLKGLSAGPEFSGFFGKAPYSRYHQLNYGLFIRYSFFEKFFLRPFFEISPYYVHYYQNLKTSNLDWETKDDYFSGYVAPGFSLIFCNNRLGIDVFYKFSNKPFVNDKKNVISYRLRVNF